MLRVPAFKNQVTDSAAEIFNITEAEENLHSWGDYFQRWINVPSVLWGVFGALHT